MGALLSKIADTVTIVTGLLTIPVKMVLAVVLAGAAFVFISNNKRLRWSKQNRAIAAGVASLVIFFGVGFPAVQDMLTVKHPKQVEATPSNERPCVPGVLLDEGSRIGAMTENLIKGCVDVKGGSSIGEMNSNRIEPSLGETSPRAVPQSRPTSTGTLLRNIGAANLRDNILIGHDIGVDADTVKSLNLDRNIITSEDVPREVRLAAISKYRGWLDETLQALEPERRAEMTARFVELERQYIDAETYGELVNTANQLAMLAR